jgi:hypothetical protein
LARQYLATQPIAVFTNSTYNLAAICADQQGHFVLHRLTPWKANAVEQQLDAPPAHDAILQVDARMLWHDSTPRTRAPLLLNGHVLTDHLRNGLNYFRCPPDTAAPFVLRLESDRPVPDQLAVAWLPPNTPQDWALRPGAIPSATALLGEGDWAFREYWFEWYGFTNQARINLPVEWAEEEDYLVEVRLRSPVLRPDPLRVRLLNGSGEALAEADLPADYAFYSLCARTRRPAGQNVQPFLLQELTAPGHPVEIGRISAYPLSGGHPLVVRVGTPGDEPFVQAGFFIRESDQRRPFRWTSGKAELRVYAPAGAEALTLRLTYSDRLRPAAAPPADLTLLWNDVQIDARILPDPRDEDLYIAEATVPAQASDRPYDLLTLTCAPWVPGNYGGRDSRALGVMLHRVELMAGGP